MSDNKYITARQLAEELMKNPDDIVVVTSDNFEQGNITKPKTSIGLLRYKGDITKETFTDSFDGGSYSADVVRYDEEGEKQFVKI